MDDRVRKPKREYQPPKLLTYGDLTEMTRTAHAQNMAKDGPTGNNKS